MPSQEEIDESRAEELALRRLDRREYSCHEIREHLRARGVPETVADAVTGRLVSRGFIDDLRYARIITGMQLRRGKGERYILAALARRGVRLDLNQVRSWISEIEPERSDVERAREILSRRYPGYEEDRKIAQRAYAGLLRRGFSSDVARRSIFK